MGSALLETMTAQVVEECDGNSSAAQQEADAIQAEAEGKSAAQRESTQAATDSEMVRLDERWRQMAHAEASRADLVVKNEAAKAVMHKVAQEIRSIVDNKEFPSVLDSLMETLVREIKGEVMVLGPEGHIDHIKTWLSNNGHDGISVEASSELWDGVALQDPARTYRISNTLTGRYSRVEQEARRVCMVNLFGGNAAEGV
jgi:vacuolar-type H+-ATPase subunit E/Vma4